MILPAQYHLPTHIYHSKALIQAVVFNKPQLETNKTSGRHCVGTTAGGRSQWFAP